MKKIIFILVILLMIPVIVQAQVRIKMTKKNGVYVVPCTVNGIGLNFIFDTGASNVCISISEALFMLKNGYMSESDIRGSTYAQIANGDIIENTSIILKEVVIGGITLQDVEASIIYNLDAPLLLGQSAIERLGKYQISENDLVITQRQSGQTGNTFEQARYLIDEAEKQYYDQLYVSASATYQKVWSLYPDAFECIDFHNMGISYCKNNKYSLAIKFLSKAENCENELDDKSMYNIFINLYYSFTEIESYDSVMICLQEALKFAYDDWTNSYCYSNIATIYYDQEEYYDAKINDEKSVEYYLKYIGKTNDDVIKGKVKDEVLGGKYWDIVHECEMLQQDNARNSYLSKAAKCGHEDAISECEGNGIVY